MKLNDVYGGKALKASDLKGRAVTVTIESVSVATFDGRDKLEVHFQGSEKTLILNKTNANRIMHNTGSDDTDHWVGKQVVLYPEKVEYQGDLVDAIRVRVEQPEVEESGDQSIPF